MFPHLHRHHREKDPDNSDDDGTESSDGQDPEEVEWVDNTNMFHVYKSVLS